MPSQPRGLTLQPRGTRPKRAAFWLGRLDITRSKKEFERRREGSTIQRK